MNGKSFGSLILLSASLCLFSCSDVATYNFKESTGYEFGQISSVKVSESVSQSFAWEISKETYSVLDRSYIKTDFDIEKAFFTENVARSSNDDAYNLGATFESGDTLNFYIRHSDRYIYFNGFESTYRSKDKVSYDFINDELLQR